MNRHWICRIGETIEMMNMNVLRMRKKRRYVDGFVEKMEK